MVTWQDFQQLYNTKILNRAYYQRLKNKRNKKIAKIFEDSLIILDYNIDEEKKQQRMKLILEPKKNLSLKKLYALIFLNSIEIQLTIQQIIFEKNNYFLNLTLNSNNFKPFLFIYNKKTILKIISKYERLDSYNYIKTLKNLNNLLLVNINQNSNFFAIIFLLIFFLFVCLKKKILIKKLLQKMKNSIYFKPTFLISIIFFSILISFFFAKKIKADSKEDFIAFITDENLEEKYIDIILKQAIVEKCIQFDEIYEMICELPISDQEFKLKYQIFKEKTDIFDLYLVDFSFDDLENVNRKNLIVLLQIKKFTLICLLESFELQDLLT